jgi:hypothetical protein
MLQPCVRPDQVSVAPVAARRLDCGQDVEVQIGDRLECLRGRRAAQRLRQGVEPRGITGLQVDQFGDGIVPMLEAAPAVNRAARADNDGGLLLLVARSIAGLARSIAQRRFALGFTASWHHRSPLRNAVQWDKPGGQPGSSTGCPANAAAASRRDSRLFVGIPGASRLFGGRCRAGWWRR